MDNIFLVIIGSIIVAWGFVGAISISEPKIETKEQYSPDTDPLMQMFKQQAEEEKRYFEDAKKFAREMERDMLERALYNKMLGILATSKNSKDIEKDYAKSIASELYDLGIWQFSNK